MRKGRKSEELNFLLHIQSFSCEAQSMLIATPTKVRQQSASRSPLQKKPVKKTRLIIPATRDIPVSSYSANIREKVETADANISTSCDFLLTVPQTPIPVFNVNKELILKQQCVSPSSPDARNSFWTPIRRSKLVRRTPLSRRRAAKSISLDLKTPPHLLSTLRSGYCDSVSRFTVYRSPPPCGKSNLKAASWLAEPLSGKLTGYSLLKRQRLKRKDFKCAPGKSIETNSEVMYGASMASSSSFYSSDPFHGGKSLFLT